MDTVTAAVTGKGTLTVTIVVTVAFVVQYRMYSIACAVCLVCAALYVQSVLCVYCMFGMYCRCGMYCMYYHRSCPAATTVFFRMCSLNCMSVVYIVCHNVVCVIRCAAYYCVLL